MALRVTLLHNSEAGFGDTRTEELTEALQDKGYTVHKVDPKSNQLAEELRDPGELVIIAGGDGTVRTVAKQLISRNVPIGLIPLGTANNIATALKIKGKPADIIKGWKPDRKKSFDVGKVCGPQGEQIFFESIGFGMLPRLIRQHKRDKEPGGSREEALEEALRHQLKILKEYKAHACTIRTDEKQYSGNYILVEAMNIPLAGPNLDLAPHADPADGRFDLVMVKEEERDKLGEFLRMRLWGEENPDHLLFIQRSRKLELQWEGIHYHVDDDAHEVQAPIKTSVEVISGGLSFLL